METIQALALEAEQLQNACNLTAVLLTAHEAGAELFRMGLSTDEVNRHPIMRAYASKIADLTGNYDGSYPTEEMTAIINGIPAIDL